jgi:hypothetical protein
MRHPDQSDAEMEAVPLAVGHDGPLRGVEPGAAPTCCGGGETTRGTILPKRTKTS